MGSTPADAQAVGIERTVLARISPTPDQLDRVSTVRAALVQRSLEVAREDGIPLERAIVAGSAARGTFVKGRLDVDLFLLFPPETSRERLEEDGLRIARRILTHGETHYAEHPYLRGEFEGFAVDAVPGYAVVDSTRPLSAVDRTPFHQEYLEAHQTREGVEQVRLTKQFLLSLRIYGADARTGGFSGYLTELLVLRFGGLRSLLTAAQDWRIPVNLRTHAKAAPRVSEEVALILDDPVDPDRNVASALNRQNLALFIFAAREYLRRPTELAFEIPPLPRLDKSAALRRSAERGTSVIVLSLARPNLVDDILYPQMRKAERALADEAERLGFRVLGTSSAADSHVLILLETHGGDLPAFRTQLGPPPGIDRVGEFVAKWSRPTARVSQGPYVNSNGRLAVDAPVEFRRIAPALSARLPHLSLGKDLSDERSVDSAVVPLESVPDSDALAEALAALLLKRLPSWTVSGYEAG